jgi:serine/threonine protein kinase
VSVGSHDRTIDPLIGTVAGNYRLVAKLGAGGMGAVYKGVHETIGSRVAIKILHGSEASGDKEGEQRFLREAQAVNRIEHDGVIKVVDAGQLESGRPFLVMELLEGQSLAEQMKAGPVPMAQACLVVADVLDALQAAHAVGVIHRDLKPPNIFRTRGGRTVVLDFGVAKLLQASSLTMTGMAIGTPWYMAPEQLLGRIVGPPADVYAAGVVLYELLCRRLPFESDDLDDVMRGHLERSPPPPRALRPEIPPAIQDIVLKALAKEPANRFESAAVMRDALRAAMTTAVLGSPEVAAQPAARPEVQTIPVASNLITSPPTTHAGSTRAPGPGNADLALSATVQLRTREPSMDDPPTAAARAVDARRGLAPRIDAPASPPPRRSRAPWLAGLALVGIAGSALIAWKLASSSSSTPEGSSNPPSDRGAQADDAKTREAVTPDAATPDASTHDVAQPQPRSLVPPDHAAVSQAARLPTMRNRLRSECKAPVALERPPHPDATIAQARFELARYRNLLACKHVTYTFGRRELEDRYEAAVQAGDGEAALAAARQLVAVAEAITIDRDYTTTRAATLAQYAGDPRLHAYSRELLKELLRDARAELDAGRYESANIVLDYGMSVVLKSPAFAPR